MPSIRMGQKSGRLRLACCVPIRTLPPPPLSPRMGPFMWGLGSLSNRLFAINPNGTQKWAFLLGDEFERSIQSSPTIGADGTIYVGSLNGKFYAINPNGTQKWVLTTTSAIYSSVAIGVTDHLCGAYKQPFLGDQSGWHSEVGLSN